MIRDFSLYLRQLSQRVFFLIWNFLNFFSYLKAGLLDFLERTTFFISVLIRDFVLDQSQLSRRVLFLSWSFLNLVSYLKVWLQDLFEMNTLFNIILIWGLDFDLDDLCDFLISFGLDLRRFRNKNEVAPLLVLLDIVSFFFLVKETQSFFNSLEQGSVHAFESWVSFRFCVYARYVKSKYETILACIGTLAWSPAFGGTSALAFFPYIRKHLIQWHQRGNFIAEGCYWVALWKKRWLVSCKIAGLITISYFTDHFLNRGKVVLDGWYSRQRSLQMFFVCSMQNFYTKRNLFL